jgi:hypothetical protein
MSTSLAKIDSPARRLADACHAGGNAQAGRRLHRHVAHADVGTALRGDLQVEAPFALDRNENAHGLAIDLHLAKELVLVRDAGRKLGGAELHLRVAFGGELEPLPVHVVPARDVEADFHSRSVERAGGEAERLLRLQQIVGAAAELELREGRQGQQQARKQKEDSLQDPVSPATQARYAGRPRSIGTAMISGSS